MQQVNFSWELIIADDFSTDGTREILFEYKNRYPNFITLLLQDKNVGAEQNWIDLLSYPKSKYIAYFEGDDCWTIPYKLQKQVDFLEKNPDYGLVFTDADHYYVDHKTFVRSYDKTNRRRVPSGNVLDELLYDNPYKSCTSLFRSKYISELVPLIEKIRKHKFKMGDIILWIIIARVTKVGYIPISTVLYRHQGQSSSNSSDIRKSVLFARSNYKRSIFITEYFGLHVNKKKLKNNYRKYIISRCIVEQKYFYLFKFSFHFHTIIYLLVKEKIIKKMLITVNG